MNKEKQNAKYTVKLFHNVFGDKDKYICEWNFENDYEGTHGDYFLQLAYDYSQNILCR